MAGFKINTGTIKLEIDCDGEINELCFNPNDVTFVNKVYSIIEKLEEKSKEIELKEKEIDGNTEIGKNEIPENTKEKLSLLEEICAYMREQIDILFGENTCQELFRNTNELEVYRQFFEGLLPFITKERKEKTEKYKRQNNKKNVMK